jgi:predicted DNA-binding transcriptional regulator
LFNDDPQIVLTVKDLQLKFYISPTTAKHDIVGLVEKGILKEISFNKVKKGYVRSDKFDQIIN